jgi:hypothetical protein
MKIKMFVFQHMPSRLPECFDDKTIYTPIQCGRAINKPIAGTIGDDTGDNISSLNASFNEMTALYWIARHFNEIGNPEYIGFNHYRRQLNWNESMLSPNAIVARRWFSWRTLRGQYACCHDIANLDEFSRIFKETFTEKEYRDYDAYWRTHFFYICNMFIMHRDNFKRYSAFILRCIKILKNIQTKNHDSLYQKRAPGFILEAMTSYWIWHEKRKKTVNLIPTTITHYNIENKINGNSCINKRAFLWFLRQAY